MQEYNINIYWIYYIKKKRIYYFINIKWEKVNYKLNTCYIIKRNKNKYYIL